MAKLIEITGKALSGEWGSEDENGIGIPILRTTNFTNEGVINYNNVVTRIITKKYISKKYLRKGDIIIEKSGGSDKQPVGRVVYYDGLDNTYLFNNFTALLRVKNQKIWVPRYVFYALLKNYRQGGTIPFENKTTGLHNLKIDAYINNFKINEIPINIQQKICVILDKIQGIIRVRKQQLIDFDTLTKARFMEMFGDPVSNSKGWEIVPLGKRCEIVTGNTPSRAESENYGEYIEWIKSDNINTPFTFITKAQEYLSETGFKKCRFVEAGSLLMTCIAGSINCIGNVAVTDRRVAFNQQINAIVPEQDEVLYLYWLMLLSKPAIHSTINMALKGILSKGKLSELTFPFPPIELQRDFVAFVEQTDKSKSVIQKSLKETQLLFDSLMQEYFG